MQYNAIYDSPLGQLVLFSNGTALTGLYFADHCPDLESAAADLPVFRKTKVWLDVYFRGEDSEIDIPLAPEGTEFQKQVWDILLTVPKGQTRSYGSIAQAVALRMGKEKMSSQAVGQAVGRNPISIIIPCHRVVGTKGQLTGYASGLEKKIWLLSHEEVML